MSPAIINKTENKPNMAIGMVHSCLEHYKHFKRPVESITLSPKMWRMFQDGLIRMDPEKEDDINMTDWVSFKDCKVKKGSVFMIKSLTVQLKTRVLD
jgi:hypothetical protein